MNYLLDTYSVLLLISFIEVYTVEALEASSC
jgi:hypothetical protein